MNTLARTRTRRARGDEAEGFRINEKERKSKGS